jgi:hypothetical protein
LPYGICDRLILGNTARNYTSTSIAKFEEVLTKKELEYYEYQYAGATKLFDEVEHARRRNPNFCDLLKRKLKALMKSLGSMQSVNSPNTETSTVEANFGAVTWRRVDLAKARASQDSHIEGVVCGVWEKPRY